MVKRAFFEQKKVLGKKAGCPEYTQEFRVVAENLECLIKLQDWRSALGMEKLALSVASYIQCAPRARDTGDGSKLQMNTGLFNTWPGERFDGERVKAFCSIYKNLAWAFRQVGNFQRAIELLELALTLVPSGDTNTKGWCIELGICCEKLGQYDRAIDLYKKSILILNQTCLLPAFGPQKDTITECSLYNNMANCYYCLGHYPLAIDIYKKTTNVLDDLGQKLNTSQMIFASTREMPGGTIHGIFATRHHIVPYCGQANCYLSLGQIKWAIELFLQARVMAKDFGDKMGEGESCSGLGKCFLLLGQYARSISFHQQSLNIAKASGDTGSEAMACNNLGSALNKQGDNVSAARILAYGLGLQQRIERDVGGRDDRRVSLSQVQQTTYILLQRVLLELGRDEWALGVCCQSKARALTHSLRTGGVLLVEDQDYEEMCRAWWEEVQGMARSEGGATCIVEFSFLPTVQANGKLSTQEGKLVVWVVSGKGDLMVTNSVHLHENTRIQDREDRYLSSNTSVMDSISLTLFRGNREFLKLNANSRTIRFEQFSTMRSKHMCPKGSKGYFEIELISVDRVSRFGFVSAKFPSCHPPLSSATAGGVGDDCHSWAVDGRVSVVEEKRLIITISSASEAKPEKKEADIQSAAYAEASMKPSKPSMLEWRHMSQWHNYARGRYKIWKAGDVIGLACDLQAMQILVSVNGNFGHCQFSISPDDVQRGLFAAFSCQYGPVRYNLGEVPFKYAPPSADYTSFVSFQEEDALEGACIRKEFENVMHLIGSGADIRTVEEGVRRNLMIAAIAAGHSGMVQKLTESKMNLDFTDPRGMTSLMLASEAGQDDIVETLVAAGSQVHLTDTCGMTSLMIACAKRHEGSAKMLIAPTHSADALNLQSDNGYSALLWAQATNLTSVVHMLQQCGATLSPPDVLLFRGNWENIIVNTSDRIVAFNCDFSTFRSRQRCPIGGRGYYEIEILKKNDEFCFQQFGFVSNLFEQDLGPFTERSLSAPQKWCINEMHRNLSGVGDDDASWAVDGVKQRKFHGKTGNGGRSIMSGLYPSFGVPHKESGEQCECEWRTGDIVGLACNLDDMEMLVSVNGTQVCGANGRVFELPPDNVRDGLFAAFSCKNGKVRYNLGEVPFKHAPPSADYKAFVDFDEEDALEGSCVRKEFDNVVHLINCNADIHAVDVGAARSLMIAAIAAGHAKIVQVLVNSKLNLNFTDERGMTALDMSEGKAEIRHILIEAGAKHSVFFAVEENKLDMLTALVAEGADFGALNQENYSGLMLALKRGHAEAADKLIEPTAATGLLDHLLDESGRSCLILASSQGFSSVVQKLLLFDAKPGHVDNHKRTSLLHAILRAGMIEEGDLVQLTTNYFRKGTVVMDSGVLLPPPRPLPPHAAAVSAEQAAYLNMIQPRTKDALSSPHLEHQNCKISWDDGMRLRHRLSGGMRHHPPDEGDADMRSSKDLRRIALGAKSLMFSEVAEMLIAPTKSAGVLDLQDSNGKSSLMLASERGLGGVVRHLLAEGAHVQLVDQNGMTALMLACVYGHQDVAKMLVLPTYDAAMLDAECNNGKSALFFADQMDLLEVIHTIRECGAKVLRSPVIFRGVLLKVNLDVKERIVDFGTKSYDSKREYSTIRSRQRCPLGKQGYYEIEFLEVPEVGSQSYYGFTNRAFERELGNSTKYPQLTEDKCSWTVSIMGSYSLNPMWSGYSAQKRLSVASPRRLSLRSGDVLGLACDLTLMKIMFAVNGQAQDNFSIDLKPEAVDEGLFAVFFGQSERVHYNFGESPFKYSPPSEKEIRQISLTLQRYEPIESHVVTRTDRLETDVETVLTKLSSKSSNLQDTADFLRSDVPQLDDKILPDVEAAPAADPVPNESTVTQYVGAAGGFGAVPLCPSGGHAMEETDDYSSEFCCRSCGLMCSGKRWWCRQCHDSLCFDCRPAEALVREPEASQMPDYKGLVNFECQDLPPIAEIEEHIGITCSGCCVRPIRGRRWSCVDCPIFNFNLCNECHEQKIEQCYEPKKSAIGVPHSKIHSFERITPPWHVSEVEDVLGVQLWVAACKGDTATVSTLLCMSGAHSFINYQDKKGCTPLYMAAQQGQTSVTGQLIAARCNIDLQENDGCTPLCIAVQNGHAAVTEQLIAARCNVDLQTNRRYTPLHFAAVSEHEAVTKQLLAARCNVDLQEEHGFTPLILAAFQGHAAVTEQLIAARCNIDFQEEKDGCTPLSIAVKNGHASVTKQLLVARCNVHLQMKDGRTALLVAELQGHSSIATLIQKSKDADRAMQETPLQAAAGAAGAAAEVGSAGEQDLVDVARCSRDHTLSMLSSGNLWKCDVCSTRQTYNPRLRCVTCDFDLCKTCSSSSAPGTGMTGSIGRSTQVYPRGAGPNFREHAAGARGGWGEAHATTGPAVTEKENEDADKTDELKLKEKLDIIRYYCLEKATPAEIAIIFKNTERVISKFLKLTYSSDHDDYGEITSDVIPFYKLTCAQHDVSQDHDACEKNLVPNTQTCSGCTIQQLVTDVRESMAVRGRDVMAFSSDSKSDGEDEMTFIPKGHTGITQPLVKNIEGNIMATMLCKSTLDRQHVADETLCTVPPEVKYIQQDIHNRVQCDGCSMIPVRGNRYKCTVCQDFDFCEDCYLHKVHQEGHTFWLVPIPGMMPPAADQRKLDADADTCTLQTRRPAPQEKPKSFPADIVNYIFDLVLEQVHLRKLYKVLIEPVEDKLLGFEELLILPHKELFEVPWTALIDGDGRYLIQLYVIRVAPSLRVAWQTAKKLQQVVSDSHAMVVGNPFPNLIGNLEHAETEARVIVDTLGGCVDVEVRSLNKHAASKSKVKNCLHGASWAHFACHADVDTDSLALAMPGATNILNSLEQSTGKRETKFNDKDFADSLALLKCFAGESHLELRFSIGTHVQCKHPQRGWAKPWVTGRVNAHNYEQPAGTFHTYQVRLDNGAGVFNVKQDSNDYIRFLDGKEYKQQLLRAKEINLSMYEVQDEVNMANGATVVLSACNTARGEVKAEGVVGLARGFFFAGASAIVASLWSVNDGSTAALMDQMYKYLARGLTVPQALRRAQLHLARRPLIPLVTSIPEPGAAGATDQIDDEFCNFIKVEYNAGHRGMGVESVVPSAAPFLNMLKESSLHNSRCGRLKPRLSDISLKVAQVRDVFAEGFDDEFLEMLLKEMDGSVERVVQALLEDSIPSSLKNIFRCEHNAQQRKEYWKEFCARKVRCTCILDFAYKDEAGLNLPSYPEDKRLLERLYCFEDCDCDEGERRRVIMKVHTLRGWKERGNKLSERAARVTAVKVIYAYWNNDEGVYEQETGKNFLQLLPVSRVNAKERTWQIAYENKRYSEIEWKWRVHGSMPSCEDCSNQDTVQVYDQVRAKIEQAEDLFRPSSIKSYNQFYNCSDGPHAECTKGIWQSNSMLRGSETEVEYELFTPPTSRGSFEEEDHTLDLWKRPLYWASFLVLGANTLLPRQRDCQHESGEFNGRGGSGGSHGLGFGVSECISFASNEIAVSPFGAADVPATQGAFGGGFGATTTGAATGTSFASFGVTAASPFGTAAILGKATIVPNQTEQNQILGGKAFHDWTVEEVCELVRSIGLTVASDILKANCVDGKTLISSDFDQYLTMDISKGGLGLQPMQKMRLMTEIEQRRIGPKYRV